ncbi:MAG: phospholipase D-like domain-containing protein [Thalassobaculaceae bacterium]|nr:phospholipase D-like domain-containing protein [Thalassobaculaceae bacterium]
MNASEEYRAAAAHPDNGAIDAPTDPASESVTPLIEASEAYPVLEERIFSARHEVLLAFRLLDPSTKIRSGRLQAAGLRTWGDLIATVAARGIDIRILLTDFEPTVATDLHKLTWAAVRGFRAARAVDGQPRADAAAGPQIIAALHEAKVGKALRWLFWPLVWFRIRSMAQAQGVRPDALLGEAPGLAPLLGTRDNRVLLPRLGPPPRLRPATYHQKLAIIDRAFMVIGGLDVDERRFDTPDHDLPAEDTWHDISLAVTGPTCAEAHSHFVDCWNRETKPFNRRLKRLRRFVRNMPPPVERMDRMAKQASAASVADSALRFVRTVSRQRRTLTEFGPRPAVLEIEQAHIEAIGQAERFIYIESQFLRSRSIVRALVDAAHTRPSLHLVILLPSAPQEVLFEGATDPTHRHGEWLQLAGLDAIIDAYGARAGVFSLVNRHRRAPVDEAQTDDRRSIGGHPVIYIHSKVCIVDHRKAIVSSANLNGRSLRWDTEAGVVWEDADGVRAFERRIWDAHLGSELSGKASLGDDDAQFRLWIEAAEGGFAAAERRSSIAPYPLDAARAFARRSWFVPDNLV